MRVSSCFHLFGGLYDSAKSTGLIVRVTDGSRNICRDVMDRDTLPGIAVEPSGNDSLDFAAICLKAFGIDVIPSLSRCKGG